MSIGTGSTGYRVAAMVAIAFFNPYTPFGRDAGVYWLGAFAIPVLSSLAFAAFAAGVSRRVRSRAVFMALLSKMCLPAVAIGVTLLWVDV